jgi:hypothetical protein
MSPICAKFAADCPKQIDGELVTALALANLRAGVVLAIGENVYSALALSGTPVDLRLPDLRFHRKYFSAKFFELVLVFFLIELRREEVAHARGHRVGRGQFLGERNGDVQAFARRYGEADWRNFFELRMGCTGTTGFSEPGHRSAPTPGFGFKAKPQGDRTAVPAECIGRAAKRFGRTWKATYFFDSKPGNS